MMIKKNLAVLWLLILSALTPADYAHASNQMFTAKPQYDVVYPDDRIVDFKIKITPQDWTAMQDNMRKLYGEPGAFPPKPGPAPGPAPAPGQPPGPPPSMPTEKPMWVQGEIIFEGQVWSNVAIRYKGNSSLLFSWMSGSHKLPFKIDFEKFGPKKRKFYGFKEMSLSNNFADPSYLREPFAYRLLKAMGLPSSHTALYRITVDYGSGEKDYGLYTAIEVTNDTVVENVFGEDDGNIYEGDGRGTTLEKALTPDKIKASFEKENNKQAADWSDVLGLHNTLHQSTRQAQPLLWREDFEKVFGVNDFLKFLAFGSVLEHWDTYGAMTHNFYLYNQNGQLQWISWDHNLILGAGFGSPAMGLNHFIQAPPGASPGFPSVSFARTEVTDKWPLIRFLLDDPVYNQEYQNQLTAIKTRYFHADKIEVDLRARARTIRAALDPKDYGSFDQAVDALIQRIYEREQKLSAYLSPSPLRP